LIMIKVEVIYGFSYLAALPSDLVEP
jgi:hypothetical protein